jgi:trehalose 6-phosphate phosphatase
MNAVTTASGANALPPSPRTLAGGAGLAALLTSPGRALVALDYDGTLAPIVTRPMDAVPAPGAIDALAEISKRVGMLAIVTGRPIEALLELSGLADRVDLPSLVVLGQYGVQRWDAATKEITSVEELPGVAVARTKLPELVADAPPGTTIEDKGHGLVVHVRRTSNPDAALAALAPALQQLAEENGLEAAPGKKVIELRPPGHDKGDCLRTLVAEHDAKSVLFAGDDVGDLAAFNAVEAMRADGVPGITVCSDGPEVPPALRERADLVVPGTEGVVALLGVLAAKIDDF